MKILEKGPGWGITQFCTGKGNGDGGCNSKLLVEKEDIYLTSHVDLDGVSEYYYTFRCPVCGIETDIPKKDVPNVIQRELLENKRNTYSRRMEWR